MKRKTTDSLFGKLFFLMVFVWIGIDIWGYSSANPYRVNGPIDAGGKFCGISPGYEDYKYLYFTAPLDKNITSKYLAAVCVKECPDKT
jgi:hypothetical protein